MKIQPTNQTLETFSRKNIANCCSTTLKITGIAIGALTASLALGSDCRHGTIGGQFCEGARALAIITSASLAVAALALSCVCKQVEK